MTELLEKAIAGEPFILEPLRLDDYLNGEDENICTLLVRRN